MFDFIIYKIYENQPFIKKFFALTIYFMDELLKVVPSQTLFLVL